MIGLFAQGMIIGLSIAAPVGPIGLLCINRTITSGLWGGLLTGLGAALADAIYGCIAGFGLVTISQYLFSQQMMIRFAGGVFLLYLGVKTFIAVPKANLIPDSAKTRWQDFSSSLFLTLTNPATIIAFIAIYTSLGLVGKDANYRGALAMVSGVFLGSFIWWCTLSSGINLIRHRLSNAVLRRINRLSGLILMGFGIFSLMTLK